MMKNSALEKAAAFSPEQIFVLSALGGAGSFGAMRLLTEALHRAKKPQPVENAVNIDLPSSGSLNAPSIVGPQVAPQTEGDMISKVSNTVGVPDIPADVPTVPTTPTTPAPQDSALPEQTPGYVKMLSYLGLPVGFLGAKYLYDTYKGNEAQKQIDKAKQQYLAQLQAAQLQQQKFGSATPCVDEFCTAVAEELNKTALFGINAPSPADVTNVPSGMTAEQLFNLKDSAPVQNAVQDHWRKSFFHQSKKVGDTLSLGTADIGKQGLILAALLGGTGTLGLLLNANASRKAKEQKAQYPNKVVYGNSSVLPGAPMGAQ